MSRFDFTKGFGNNPKGSNDPWGSHFDADRIALLKRMTDQIWDIDTTIYIILEHFAENSEEINLANYGMLLWGNSQYSYAEASMGYHTNGKSDFSWGYYGSKMMLKSFIDECHRRGIAVIMDIVLNHSYSQSPFVRLYNYGEWGSPTDENPWFNTESNFSNPDAQWGNDLNHESIHTKQLVDRINRYWIEEYHLSLIHI